VFWLGPVFSVGAALLAIAGLAFGRRFKLRKDLDIGLLFVVGNQRAWHFELCWAAGLVPFLVDGALRSSAQLVSS